MTNGAGHHGNTGKKKDAKKPLDTTTEAKKKMVPESLPKKKSS